MDDSERRRIERWALQAGARDLMPGEFVAQCLRRTGFDRESGHRFKHVRVMFSEQVQRAHYKNLFLCGSVWMCPICGAKISERRRVELSAGIESNGFQVGLASFTESHSMEDKLSGLLGGLLEAYRRLKSGRQWLQFANDHGLVGSIRSLENTYGVNGHHPHLHALLFFKAGFDLVGVEDDLRRLWRAALEHVDQSASWEHGVDYRSAAKDIADYVTKMGREPKDLKHPKRWTMEMELTKSSSKMGRGAHGFSMLELLRLHVLGDSRAGQVWQEYARCFKGKHQLGWTRGLRKLLGLGREESDLKLAVREDEEASLLATLDLNQWRVILANDARGEVLEAASSGDVEQLQRFLRSIGAL